MLAALAFGYVENARILRERDAAAQADRELWVGQSAKNPHAAAHFGQYAFKPLSPLALADPGVDAYVGSAVWLEAHKQNETQFKQARDGGVGARLGSLSLAFILQTIAPLIVILMGFASFSGERESGTLKQLLSVGARPRDILAGKAMALIGAIFALLAPAFVGAALALVFFVDRERLSLADQFIRLGALGAAYAAYLAGFAFLALGVSALARNSRAALVTLLAFWLVNSFLAPRLATDAARAFAPTPTWQEFRAGVAQDKAKTFGHDESHPAFVAFRDETLKKYGVSRIEDLPVSFRGLALRKDDESGYAIFDRHFGALQSAFDRQDALRAAPGFLFPLLALRPISMAFAGRRQPQPVRFRDGRRGASARHPKPGQRQHHPFRPRQCLRRGPGAVAKDRLLRLSGARRGLRPRLQRPPDDRPVRLARARLRFRALRGAASAAGMSAPMSSAFSRGRAVRGAHDAP